MSAIESPRVWRRRARRPSRQAGATAVEFALVAMLFFTLLFFLIDLARALYMWNTLVEVSRRAALAAANTDVADEAAKNLVRQNAIFRDSAGTLSWGAPVSDQNVRIDYFSLSRASDGTETLQSIPTALLPACPTRNRINCNADQNGNNCVRFVRVRICATGTGEDTCDAVPYQSLTALYTFSFGLPLATTIAKAQTLGYQPGSPSCP